MNKVKTSIYIDKDILDKLKIKAKEENRSVNSLIVSYVKFLMDDK